jgi:limonene-1,2-epoxide hydrolase
MTVDDTTRAKLNELFARIDAKDTERFLEFLTDSASFRFGSAPSASGREAIRAAVDGFFASIAASKHELSRITEDTGVIICEGTVTYTRHSGSQITLPFANFLELEGDRISNYKIYADAGPLYAE